MTDVGISALATWLGPIIIMCASMFGVLKWAGDMIEKRISNLDAKVGVTTTNIEHKLRNTVTRVDALEHIRATDVERIVKLETALQGVERSMERLEKGQDKLDDTINDRFDQLAESIREVRVVTPRP